MADLFSLDAALAEAERSDPAFEWDGRVWRLRPPPAPIFVRLLRKAQATADGDTAAAKRADDDLRRLLGATDDYALVQGLMHPDDWPDFEARLPSLAVIGEIGRNLLVIYGMTDPGSSPSSTGSTRSGRGPSKRSKRSTTST